MPCRIKDRIKMEYLERALQDGGDLEARGQLALCFALTKWKLPVIIRSVGRVIEQTVG